MPSLNKVILVGNLTRDPDVRHTPKGKAVGDINIAINESYKTESGEIREDVTYVEIVVWGKSAENCKQYLAKGSPVLVEGKLKLEQWETPEGSKRSKLKVSAERVQFLGSRQGRAGAPTSNGSSKNPSENPDDEMPY